MAVKPIATTQRSSIWPLVAACFLGLVLLFLATVIILSLIPVYLRNRNIKNVADFQQTRNVQANYVLDSNIPVANIDQNLLAREFEKQMNAPSGLLSIGSLESDTAVQGRRRRAVQCMDNGLTGPVMRLGFVASNTPFRRGARASSFCLNENCMATIFGKLQQRFTQNKDFIIPIFYRNSNERRNVRFRLCSIYFDLLNSPTTAQTLSSTTTVFVSPKKRAMVNVQAKSTVGVLFDEIPVDVRDKAKSLIDSKDEQYWRDMATQQMQYTQVRLIFRPLYYDEQVSPNKRGTLSLTLPKFFRFTFTTPPKFTTIDGHLLYAREYTFENVLITDVDSLAESDDRLAVVGGTASEVYSLPVDPYLLLQRTGFDCISEEQWPPNSVDPETVEIFYDDTCEVEAPQDPDINGCQQCHCSYPLPTLSCVDSLKKNVGHVEIDLKFTRIADNASLADEWRYPPEGPSINKNGEVATVNIFEDHEALAGHRIVYLYIEPDGCEIVEQCVGGPGWRRLLVFSTTTPNYGTEDLVLGSISYFVDQQPSDYVTKYRMYEYSPCHKHFHFSHYGTFTFGKQNPSSNSKRGFCLQTTYRHANTEWSVMSQNHFLCSNQGIAPGWSDTYQGGIRCQWIDVTNYDTSKNTYTDELISQLNPDGFLCEGRPLNETWIETDFKTQCCSGSGCCGETPLTNCCGGLPVSKQGCQTWNGASDDNTAKLNVTVPLAGEGQVTANCSSSSGAWGEKRDCGFRLHPQGKMLSCSSPGKNAVLSGVTSTSKLQVVRVCEASIVLDSCLACIWNSSLTTVIVREGETPKDINFMCTPARDGLEVGGKFCVYVSPYFEEDNHDPDYIRWSSIA